MEEEKLEFTLTVNNLDIDNYGGIKLPISGNKFFELGYKLLDMIEVDLSDHKMVCPLVPDYNYIDSGVCAIAPVNGMENQIFLLANGGQFVVLTDVAKRTPNGWAINSNIKFPLDIKFRLIQRDGYKETYEIYAYLFSRRSNNREDYPELSDADYCNFRTVTGGSIKPGILYRSSNPIKPRFKRNWYADKECEKAGITKIFNVSENPSEIEECKNNPEYKNSYYLKQDIYSICLPADYKDYLFLEGLKNGLKFISKNKGKSLIHCMEGKDRTGFIIAVLQALMGASIVEIMKDYSKSHCNFFKVDEKDHTMPLIQTQIVDYLSDNFDTPFYNKNLSEKAYEYLVKVGLNPAEIEQIKKYLRGE